MRVRFAAVALVLLGLSACAETSTPASRLGVAYVASGKTTAPPVGLIIYCQSNPAECGVPSNARALAEASITPPFSDVSAVRAASRMEAPSLSLPLAGLMPDTLVRRGPASDGGRPVPTLALLTGVGDGVRSSAVDLCEPAALCSFISAPSDSALLAQVATAQQLQSATPAIGADGAMELAMAEAAIGPSRGARAPQPVETAAAPGRWDRRSSSMPLGLIAAVNDQINAAIIPATDMQIYGVEERWARPLKTMASRPRGNCKDYAMEKRARLIELGAPPESLSLALVDAPGFGRHVVLVVATETGDLVLDNLAPDLRRPDRTNYHWIAVQSGADLLNWSSAEVAHGPYRITTASNDAVFEAAIAGD
jgi:predicted transglutaminase-like cysteine proteinase